MRRSVRGSSLFEVVVTLGVGLTIVAGAGAIAKSSGDLAASSGMIDGASRRVQRVLETVQDEVRRASLASIERPDGSDLDDGDTADGLSFRRVTAYRGGNQLDAVASLARVAGTGGSAGDLVRTQGGIEEILARDVTEFSVERRGDTFVVTVAVRLGTDDDRGRVARGSVAVRARNP